MSERVCRHCGGTYRGLACPCRKRAWAEARAMAEGGKLKDEEVQVASSGGSDGSDRLSVADGKG